MALSLSIIGGAAGVGSFVTQVQAGLQATCTAILAEASSTPDYVVRRKFAQLVEKNLPAFAQAMAVPVASQVQTNQPTTYTDLTNVSDAHITTAISGLFTQVAYANVLPS